MVDQDRTGGPGGQPLRGLTVGVTRAGEQQEALAAPLRRLGAVVVPVPLIAIDPPADGGAALRRAAADLGRYRWVVLTSANGARALVEALPDGADLRGVRTAAVGPATASVLRAAGAVDPLVPARHVAEGLLAAFPHPERPGQDRVALVRAEVAREVLPDGLRALGYAVDMIAAYRTVSAAVDDGLRAALASVDVVTFASPSALHRFVELVGRPIGMAVAVIGPVTAAAAAEAGVAVDVMAERSDMGGLIDAIVSWAAGRQG